MQVSRKREEGKFNLLKIETNIEKVGNGKKYRNYLKILKSLSLFHSFTPVLDKGGLNFLKEVQKKGGAEQILRWWGAASF